MTLHYISSGVVEPELKSRLVMFVSQFMFMLPLLLLLLDFHHHHISYLHHLQHVHYLPPWLRLSSSKHPVIIMTTMSTSQPLESPPPMTNIHHDNQPLRLPITTTTTSTLVANMPIMTITSVIMTTDKKTTTDDYNFRLPPQWPPRSPTQQPRPLTPWQPRKRDNPPPP